MPRGRRAVELTAETAGAETAEVPEEAAASDQSGGPGLSLFDASGDARIRLLRRDDKTQKWIPHGYLPPDSTEETILRLFGGGTYWSQLLVQTDVGREGIKQQRKFSLSGLYKPPLSGIPGIDFAVTADGKQIPTTRTDAPQNGATVIGNIPTSGDDLMSVLKAGIINTLLEMMKSNKEMRGPTGPDPMLLKLMEQQAVTNQQMMQFMLTLATKENGDSKKDILDMMARMKDLVGPPPTAPLPADPMQMFNNMLETFRSFRETAEEINPPRDNGDPVMGAIPKLVEVVAEQHQMQKAARNAAMTHVPTPAPHGGVAQMPSVHTVQPDVPMWRLILRQQGARLMASAASKADPDVIAGAAILFAPPAVKEALIGFFKRDENEVMADILTEIPALAEHREWLAEFVQCAQERLFPEEFTDEQPEAEAEGPST